LTLTRSKKHVERCRTLHEQYKLFCHFLHSMLQKNELFYPFKLVMGPGEKNFTRVRLGQFIVARVRSGWVNNLWFGSSFGKFTLKIPNFSIFCLQVKKNIFGPGQKAPGSKTGWPLIYIGSKVCSGWVRAHLYLKLPPSQF